MDTFETVYYSMLGELEDAYDLPWVDNAFASGSACEEAYSRIPPPGIDSAPVWEPLRTLT